MAAKPWISGPSGLVVETLLALCSPDAAWVDQPAQAWSHRTAYLTLSQTVKWEWPFRTSSEKQQGPLLFLFLVFHWKAVSVAYVCLRW